MLDKSPIKWRQHPDMTIAVDWDVIDLDVRHQFKRQNIKSVFDVKSFIRFFTLNSKCKQCDIHVYMGHYQKMEQSRKAKRKNIIVQFFLFNEIVLLTRAYII